MPGKEKMIQEIIELEADAIIELVRHSDREELENRLRNLSGIDGLTGEEVWEQWSCLFPDSDDDFWEIEED